MAPQIVNLGPHTWREFTTRAAERANSGPATGGGNESVEGSESFSGTKDFATALRMAREGWQQGAREISRALDSLPPEAQCLPDWQLEAAGAFPCVPAFLTGEPECIWRHADGARSERRLALIVPHSFRGGLEASEAQQYAKAVAAIVRGVEASGIEPAVFSMSCSSGAPVFDPNRQLVTYSIAIREFGEPLDLAKVAFAFHPSFYRRLGFAWRERTPEAVAAGVANGGYGMTAGTTPKHLAMCAKAGNVGEGSAVAILPPVHDMGDKGLLVESRLPELIAAMRECVISAINGGTPDEN